ncbi:MAG TPA: VOC family protein, partial [Bacteroidota bacterium]|nr:VOC family protein [Bacteroidota bacterium]
SSHMQDKVLELMRLGIRPTLQKSADGERMQHEFFDPNEMNIMLMHFDDASMPSPNGFSESRLGTFGELAIDTGSVDESVGFYQKLDFRVVLRGTKPYPWAILSDGTMTLGFHETQNFRSPALTYYAPDVESRLRTVRGAGISAIRELYDDQRRTAGAVLTAPDGQLLFLLEGE